MTPQPNPIPDWAVNAARQAYDNSPIKVVGGLESGALIQHFAKAINDAVMAERERDQWQAIETAPNEGPFLAYGSYLYPGDKGVTEYTSIVERSGDPAWPWSTPEGNAAKEAFSHWMPLPAAPKSEG